MTTEQQTTSEKTVFTFKGIQNKPYKLTEVNALNPGRNGMVYRVRNDTSNVLVLKINNSGDINNFVANAKQHYDEQQKSETAFSHFVKVTDYGTVNENGTSVPALLMEYGGVDLSQAYTAILSLSPEVQEAFRYKVILTMLAGIEQAQKAETYHGDLHPRNVLCGFDIPTGSETSLEPSLEEKVIEGQVRLGDPDRKGIGTLLSQGMSFQQNDLPFYMRMIRGLYDLPDHGRSIDGDVNSALNIFEWLTNGKEDIPLEKFIEQFGLQRNYDISTRRYTMPKPRDVRTKLETWIIDKKYFLVDNGEGVEKIVVRRPVDQFRHDVKDKTDRDKSNIEGIFNTGSNAYEKLRKRLPTTDTTELNMQGLLTEYLVRSTVSLEESRKKKADERAEPEKLLKELKDKLGKCAEQQAEYERHVKEAETQFETARSITNRQEMVEKTTAALGEITKYQQSLTEVQEVIKSKAQQCGELDQIIKSLQTVEEEAAVQYIAEISEQLTPDNKKKMDNVLLPLKLRQGGVFVPRSKKVESSK